MRRTVLTVLLLAAAFTGSVSAAPAPKSAETMVSRCMKTPDVCKALILGEAARLEAQRNVCIPASLSKDRAAFRVLETAEEALEEDPDSFKDFDYATLARQLMTFLWPCADKPIS